MPFKRSDTGSTPASPTNHSLNNIIMFNEAVKSAIIAHLKEKYGEKNYEEAFASLQNRYKTLGRENIEDDNKFLYHIQHFLGDPNPPRKDMYELLIDIINERIRNR